MKTIKPWKFVYAPRWIKWYMGWLGRYMGSRYPVPAMTMAWPRIYIHPAYPAAWLRFGTLRNAAYRKWAIATIIQRHEIAHVLQMKRDGWLRFQVQYVYWAFKYGYRQNPYEVEARILAEVNARTGRYRR